MTDPPPLHQQTRCARCRHALAFHRDGGVCRSKGCGRSTGQPCLRFQAPDADDAAPLPDRARVADALDTVTAVLEHHAGTPAAADGAAVLVALLATVPALRAAAAPGLPERLAACLEPPGARQDAEVARHDAHEVPRERPA